MSTPSTSIPVSRQERLLARFLHSQNGISGAHVLQLLADGLEQREIAARIGVSDIALTQYMWKVVRPVMGGARTTAQAIAVAMRRRVIR